MEFIEITAKTVNDAITEACQKLSIPSSKLEYEVLEEGSTGFLGLGAKAAKIKARVKEEEKTIDMVAKDFLTEVFKAMNLPVVLNIKYDDIERVLDIDLAGDDMGVLIGKRGQTLDSIQYLVSLVVNKGKEDYIRVKLDTENYRQRRKATLENLAKNIAFKVKRTKRPVSLEPMNPYERRIIHTAVHKVNGAISWSEGEVTNRHVVIGPDPEYKRPYRKNNYNNNRGGRRGYNNGYDKRRNYNNRNSKPNNNAPVDRAPKNEGESLSLYGRVETNNNN